MTGSRWSLTLGVVLIPTPAFTLHDLVFRLPDRVTVVAAAAGRIV